MGSHSWRSLFAPACPGNGFSLREGCTGTRFFISTSPRGLRGPAHSTSVITDKLGSGMPAANEAGPNLQRTIPSVRPFENGLRPVGSSATRPGKWQGYEGTPGADIAANRHQSSISSLESLGTSTSKYPQLRTPHRDKHTHTHTVTRARARERARTRTHAHARARARGRCAFALSRAPRRPQRKALLTGRTPRRASGWHSGWQPLSWGRAGSGCQWPLRRRDSGIGRALVAT